MDNCQIKFCQNNKLINKFYFLVNLAKVAKWKDKSMGIDFFSGYKINKISKKEIEKFKKIFKKVEYWDIERVFYQANTEAGALKGLSKYLAKSDILELKKIFNFFEKDFLTLYNSIDKKHSKELKDLWKKTEYQKILKKLIYLFGDKKKKYNLKVKIVFEKNFDGVFRGTVYDENIVLEVADLKDRFDLLENIIFVLLHEITHVFVKSNELIKFTINKLGITRNTVNVIKKYNIDFDNFAEEILIRMFLTRGYFRDKNKERFLNNKKITWKHAINQNQIQLHCFSMMLYKSMHKDVEKYVKKNKKIDDEFLSKMIKIIKSKVK